VHGVESGVIQVAAIHDVKRPGFDRHEVQHVDIVHLAVADVDKRSDCASQVQQLVQLDCSLAFAKRGPVEQAQAQIDGRGIKRVNCVLQVESDQIRVAVEIACTANQQRRDFGPNKPNTLIARFVRIGHRCRHSDRRFNQNWSMAQTP